MKDLDYTKAIEIHREIQAKCEILDKEWKERMKAAYGEAYGCFTCPVVCFDDVYADVDTPSEGAVFGMSADDPERDIYDLKIGDITVVEVVRR